MFCFCLRVFKHNHLFIIFMESLWLDFSNKKVYLPFDPYVLRKWLYLSLDVGLDMTEKIFKKNGIEVD